MNTIKDLFKFPRQDLSASISVFLISLPITIGIALASGVSPAAGVISAIFGALFFGLFSSSQIALYGPAAGLCVFLAAASERTDGMADIPAATIIAGVLLMLLSLVRAYRIVDLIPASVVKGMACGIGLTLVFKMVPHLFGTNSDWLNGLIPFAPNDASEPLPTQEGNQLSYTALAVSIFCLALIWIGQKALSANSRLRLIPYAFVVVLAGTGLAHLIGYFSPESALNASQMLHLNMSNLRFEMIDLQWNQGWPTLRLALVITTVILLEGSINLELVQKLDPARRPIRQRREFFLIGVANFVLGFWAALPIMPILVRSSANVEFGAKSRLSSILQGVWMVLGIALAAWFEFIPIAAVAALLVLVGLNLIDAQGPRELFKRGKDHFIPFLLTVVVILVVDLIWGVLAGLALGAFFTIRSTLNRTMVLVEDRNDYLLKFFKDVTFIHKSELRDCLAQVPEGKGVMIDGTGNIVIDPEIEEWLIDYQQESEMQGRRVVFNRSRLAISKLFKEVAHG